MITSKPSLRSGFDCIICPAPSGAGRTTPSQPGHYPLKSNAFVFALVVLDKYGPSTIVLQKCDLH